MKRSIILAITLLTAISCSAPDNEKKLVENQGYAQGSTYQIKYLSAGGKNLHDDIIELFGRVDQSMSTYVKGSMISRINTGEKVTVDTLFMQVLNRAVEVAEETDGYYDPTIGPVVSLWGFGFDSLRSDITEMDIEQARSVTGYEEINVIGNEVSLPAGFQLDFNAIAQGYTVDVIAHLLERSDIQNYMIEVGGEVRTSGVNADNKVWTIGVDKPSEEIYPADRFQFIIELDDKALATSGNYRKFWVDEDTGIRYSHTINPKTGKPAMNTLLSASIVTETGMDADVYATVCMVVGLEECKQLLDSKSELEGYLVYSDETNNWQTFITDGLQEMIKRD